MTRAIGNILFLAGMMLIIVLTFSALDELMR